MQQLALQQEKRAYFEVYKEKLKEAWDVTILIGLFDMDYDFKTTRYNPNKQSLEGLCSQFSISTSSYNSSSSSSSSSPTNTSSKYSSSSDSDFDFFANAWWIFGIIGLIIGAASGGGTGAIVGFFIGLAIGAKFLK